MNLNKLLLIMRLTTIILIAAIMQVSANSLAQKITLREKNAQLTEVFDKIRLQTGYDFLFTTSTLKDAGKVNIDVNNKELEEVLKDIFENQPLEFKIESKSVIVSRKEPSLLTVIQSAVKNLFQSIDVTGRIVDLDGTPIPGATIRVKGTNRSVVSNASGHFAILNVDEGAMIVVSYVGFTSKELPAAKDLGEVKLVMSSGELEEVTINKGYYSETRRLSTSNVGKVTTETISKQPVSNPLAALQGRIPGLVITQNTGVPGGNFTVRIRGRNNINNNGNDPFYVIDGVPFTSTTLSSNFSSLITGGNPLNNINPADIESIEVLKDADALAIYGSRGANGAILITTKKGKSGKTKVDLNFYQGAGKVNQFMDLLNTEEYLEMRREAFANDGITITSTTPNTNDLKWDNSRYTDWQKILIGGTAHYTDAQVSLSGGNNTTQFMIGSGIHRESTVFPDGGTDTKGSIRFNINHSSVNQKLKMDFSGSYLDDHNSLIRSDLTYQALTLPPNAPSIYDENGKLNWENSTWENPYAALLSRYNGRTGNLIGNALLSYEIITGLRAKTALGFTTMRLQEMNTLPLASFDPALKATSTNTQFNDNNIKTWNFEPQLDYTLNIGKNKFTVLSGITFQQTIKAGQMLTGNGYTSDALLEDIKSAGSVTVSASNYYKYRYSAVYARFNYNYDDRYVVNLTGRRDGSSRFGPEKQFSTFAALGAAWIFSNETFIKENFSFISSGKLRGSYGSSGSDNIDNYKFLDLWAATPDPYFGVKGLYATSLFNPNYAWEKNIKLEGGVNLGFLNDRLLASASYYRNRSGNQLVGIPLPTMTGFTSINGNLPATVENSGWEFDFSSEILKSKNLNWNLSFNLTVARNKLVEYPNFEKSSSAPLSYVIGYPLDVAKVYTNLGVNAETGTYEFKTTSGTPSISPAYLTDRNESIDRTPRYYGGLQNQFTYKNFTLDFFFQFVKQTNANYFIGAIAFGTPGMRGNQPVEVLNRWQNKGDETEIQRFTQNTGSPAYTAYSRLNGSNAAYSDASFIRLKNVSLSYQLPEFIKSKLKSQNARIYLQGQNIFTITKYKGLDPETFSFSKLPVLKVITAGIQFTF